jgi:uncharacterized protein YidB (DUF937 family)
MEIDGELGGIVHANLLSTVSGLIANHGGVRGIAALFEQHGLRETVQSWIGIGPNLPIAGAQLQEIFSREELRNAAARLGLDPQIAALKIAQALPEIIDKLTPTGVME